MPKVRKPTSTTASEMAVAQRWSRALISAGGFTPVSVFFLENYSRLPHPLNHAEALLVIQLIRHKFDDKAPFPGFPSLAKKMGVTPTAVRGYARSLEEKGYLKREMRTAQTNRFHLEKLFAALEALIPQRAPAPEEIPF